MLFPSGKENVACITCPSHSLCTHKKKNMENLSEILNMFPQQNDVKRNVNNKRDTEKCIA